MAVGTGSSLLAGQIPGGPPARARGHGRRLPPQDEQLGRQVAVKRLHTDSPEDATRRFAREAKLGASLSHPNLVWVFDAVADDEGVLIVMEYVKGTTLRRSSTSGRSCRVASRRSSAAWRAPWITRTSTAWSIAT